MRVLGLAWRLMDGDRIEPDGFIVPSPYDIDRRFYKSPSTGAIRCDSEGWQGDCLLLIGYSCRLLNSSRDANPHGSYAPLLLMGTWAFSLIR